jgi:DNA-binding FrmR family transcriptional regulator
MKAFREHYPSHEDQIVRLARIEGQVKGIRRMIEARRYCLDIVQQVKAVTAGLKVVQMGVLEQHIHHCVRETMKRGDSADFVDQVDVIVALIGRMDESG